MVFGLLEKTMGLVARDTVNRWLSPRARSFLRNTVGYAILLRRISTRVDAKTFMLAEYPRCGVTWLRFLIATGLHHQRTGEIRKLSPAEMEAYAPNLAGDEAVHGMHRFAGDFSVLKTHLQFNRRFERAVVIYRNPFDAIRSLYAMEVMVDPLRPLESLLSEDSYLAHQAGEFIAFYESWLPAIQDHPERYLLIKYEDLLNPPGVLLGKVFDYLRIDAANRSAATLREMAGLYERSDANFSSLDAEQRKLAASNKERIFNKISSLVAPAALEREQPALHEKLKNLMGTLDQLRCRPD